MPFIFKKYGSRKFAFYWLSEFILIFAIGLVAAHIRLRFDNGAVFSYDPTFLKTLVLSLTYLTAFYYFGLYMPDMYRPGRNMFMRLISATFVATVALLAFFYVMPSIKTWRGILLLNVMLMPLAVLAWRTLLSKVKLKEMPSKNVLVIGTGDLAKKIGKDIYTAPDSGLKLVGFIDDDPSMMGVSIVNPGVVGGYGDIGSLAQARGIDLIIVALADRRAKLPMYALLDCKLKGVQIEEGETFNERYHGNIPLNQLKPSWMVFSDGFKSLRSRKIVKRALDLVFSSLLFVMTAPLMLLAALVIKLESKGPVIFKQIRVGENGKDFKIYKFRSMSQDAEAKSGPVWAGAQDSRVTRFGKFMRKTRIDELPQLVNVLKGDMSFVGPRPERPFFVNKLKEEIPYYSIRTVVKPGLTGWAQIKYPYGATVEDAVEKLQYDIYYIKNMSPLLDLIIFMSTIKVVLTGQGAR